MEEIHPPGERRLQSAVKEALEPQFISIQFLVLLGCFIIFSRYASLPPQDPVFPSKHIGGR